MPAGGGYVAHGEPSIDAEPPLGFPPELPYADLVWTAAPAGKRCLCEVVYADAELRGMLRVVRLHFVGVLQSLGAITRERGLEILSEPITVDDPSTAAVGYSMTSAHICPVCGSNLDSRLDCRGRHRETSEAFQRTLRETLATLKLTSQQLRDVALRMDSRGDATAQQVYEQVRQAEARAKRLTELLAIQPRWPERTR